MQQTNSGHLETLFTLLAPMSHIGESHGPESFLDTQEILDPNGQPVEVFVYHGNAWRGALRDAGAKYMLDRLGRDGARAMVPLEVFHLLFSGGSIGGAQSIDLEQARRIRRAVPLLSILGGGVGNQILPGKLQVGDAYPLCLEAQHLLPEPLRNPSAISWRRQTTERSHSRKDDSKHENFRPYLHEIDWFAAVDQVGEISDKKNRKIEKDEHHQQMRYTTECLSAGARLWQRTDIQGMNSIEFGALVSCIDQWARAPYIGGQNRIGFGRCAVEITWNPHDTEAAFLVSVDHSGQLAFGELAKTAKAAYDAFLNQYQQHLIDHGEEVLTLLETH